jgi:hypothetical protein
MKKVFQLTAVFTIGAVISGCSSTGGQVASFEDLTTESTKEGFSKLPQYRIISIPGMLPFSDVGGVHFYKAKRKPSSAVGINNGNSYAIETTIESTCDQTCLTSVKEKILLVKNKAARLIEEKISLARLLSSDPKADAATIAAANTKYNTTRTELDSTHQDAMNAIKHNGVMVFRWNTNTKKSGFLGLGAMFGVSGSKDETKSGFGIISGLKTSTLYLGKDIQNTWGNLNGESKYSNRFEVTTYTMQAQYITYISENDLSSSLSANLKASYSQLSNLSDTVKNLDNIEINAALSKVSNLANIGVIGASKRNKVAIDWDNPNLLSSPSRLDGWQTIYAVKSDLKDLLDMSKNFMK